jgi:hypothetical protein
MSSLIQISLVSLWIAVKFAKNVAILLLKESDMPIFPAKLCTFRVAHYGIGSESHHPGATLYRRLPA